MIATAEHPLHTYLTSGTYEVCLRVENRFGVDSICQEVPVIFTGVEEEANRELSLRIVPNPTADYFGIQSALEISQVEVYASDGKILLSTKERTVSVRDLVGGLYIVKVRFRNGQVGFGKVVVR